jgi:tetratricopeptide (TPR) repeat protein
VARLDVSDSTLVVPFQIGLEADRAPGDGGRSLLEGRLMVQGETSSFRLETEMTPAIFWLDRDTEVFGLFFNTDRWPRRTAYLRGLDLEAAGDAEGAEKAFENALAAELAVIPADWVQVFRRVDAEGEGERLDARIRLALARLDLDAGQLDAAAAELERARDLVTSRDRWLLARELLVLESRLNLLAGDALRAFKNLRKGVLGRRGIESPETWALLAIAAHATGNTEELGLALDRAADVGVDLGPLAGDAVQ